VEPFIRVVSLLPAATEIVAALGFSDCLVGVSHECFYPPEVASKPRVTVSHLHQSALTSDELDQEVRAAVATGAPLYRLDEPLLRALKPDIILTQQLCDVCAVGYGSVAAFAATLPGPPRLITLEPRTLEEFFVSILEVGVAFDALSRANRLLVQLEKRVKAVRERCAAAESRPGTFLMEWIDPPFCAGHWNPELVELAGGQELIGQAGQSSRRVQWDEVLEARPEVLPIVCCGYDVERTRQDLEIARTYPGWDDLPAVRNGRVYLADGNAYFTVPGPRLVDSLEILAHMLHPELFPGEPEAGEGWTRWE
jgi:iron complex transport system substrate-binding protein